MIRVRRFFHRQPIRGRAKPLVAASPRRWKSLTLVWRTRLKKRPLSKNRPGRSIVQSRRSAMVSFHFNIAASFSSHLAASGSVRRSLTRIVWRVPRARPTSVRARRQGFSDLPSGKFLERHVREAVMQSRPLPETSATELRRIFKSSKLKTTEKSARLFAQSLRTIVLRKSLEPSFTERVRRPEPSRQTWRRPRPIKVEHPFADAAVVPRHTSAAAPFPLRPPELVWRIASEAAGSDPMERSGGASSVPLVAMARSEPVPVGQAPMTVAGAQAQMFDAALMDRVAEDVIGRVERRMRIERERRGI